MSNLMTFITGSTRSWQPELTRDTTTTSYWLNWRVLLSSTWVLMSIIFASFLISKYESCCNISRERRLVQENDDGILYEDEVWKPCIESVNPGWLLAYRAFAFFVLLLMLIVNVAVDGGSILYFYTQWTFMLTTIYFGLGSLLSSHGIYEYNKRNTTNMLIDTERGTYGSLKRATNSLVLNSAKGIDLVKELPSRQQTAGFWGHVFQIIFQMNAGAVVLTDTVFWFIFVPFLLIKDYDLNFLIISMHSINAVFLLGETALNSLHFPWFRIGYFILWTAGYVIFQWILHSCISLWWPYPFLDLSSTFAPLWYSSVALMHVPCYGIFVLVAKAKHSLLSKLFPQSYRYCMM